MLTSILFIIIGFFLLIKGADFLVDGASSLAKKFHISEIIIGLTIVSIGTSMPELIVSTTSAINGYSDMAVGNIIGSNIANLLLILGLSAALKPIVLKKQTRLIEVPICLLISIVFFLLVNHGQNITRVDAIILIALFVMFIIYTIVMAKKGDEFDKEENLVVEEATSNKKNFSVFKSILYIIIGIVALKVGGDFTVDNSVIIAEFFGLSEKIISVTILAVGTSLPELVTTVSAVLKKENDIAVGNIIGSNIFNMLLIIGVAALIKPITYNIAYNFDMYIVMLAVFVLFLFQFIPPKNKMSRINGMVYMAIYAFYMINLFIQG